MRKDYSVTVHKNGSITSNSNLIRRFFTRAILKENSNIARIFWFELFNKFQRTRLEQLSHAFELLNVFKGVILWSFRRLNSQAVVIDSVCLFLWNRNRWIFKAKIYNQEQCSPHTYIFLYFPEIKQFNNKHTKDKYNNPIENTVNSGINFLAPGINVLAPRGSLVPRDSVNIISLQNFNNRHHFYRYQTFTKKVFWVCLSWIALSFHNV